jgi:hypothetical protein
MAFTIPGLLGMNNQQPDPYQSLLGGYYTPQQAKMAWLGGSLQGLGAGLASGKSGAWAQGLALGGGEGLDNYRQRAVAMYGIKQRQDDREYDRQQDADAKAWRERTFAEDARRYGMDYALRKQEAEAQQEWNGIARGQQQKQWAQEDQILQGQTSAVTDWRKNFESQGGNLFTPGMQAGLREAGIAGVDPADTVKYNQTTPYVKAGDYNTAFQTMVAPPPKPEQYTLGPGQVRKDEYGNTLAEGPPKTPDTVINNGDGLKMTEAQSKDVHFYARGKYANADLTQNEDALLALGQQQGSKVPVVGNYLKTPEYRQAERAGKEFLAMILRKESGGAITAEEWQEYGPMFLPMPGDDLQTVADKRVARQRALDALKLGGGTAKPVFDQIDSEFNSSDQNSGNSQVDEILKKYPPKK